MYAFEKVQHKFLRYFMYRSGSPFDHAFDHDYTRALSSANLLNLSERRTVPDLMFLFYVLNGSIKSPALVEKCCFFVPIRVTRNPPLFSTDFYRTEFRYSNSIQRILRTANNYPFQRSLFTFSPYLYRKEILNFILPAH